MKTTKTAARLRNKTNANRFILVGSAIALCSAPIQLAHAQAAPNGENIEITIQNQVLDNQGPVVGTDGTDPGQDGGIGINLFSEQAGGISGFTLTNSLSGSAKGGNGATGTNINSNNGGNGGHGVLFEAVTINGVTVNSNAGSMIGGNGGNGGVDGGEGFAGTGGSGGHGLYLHATTSITGAVINNSVTIQGGNGGQGFDGAEGGSVTGGDGGHGILVRTDSGNTITNLTIQNSGLIQGGFGGQAFDGAEGGSVNGGRGGHGIEVKANGLNNISGVQIQNVGTIHGGDGGWGVHGNAPGNTQAYGGFAGHGILLVGDGVESVLIGNGVTGVILGGEGGYGSNGGSGGSGGDGVRLESGSGGATNINVTNSGLIGGGEGGATGVSLSGDGGEGGDGIAITNFGRSGRVAIEGAEPAIDGLAITNEATGSILGGVGGNGDRNGGDGGHGIAVAARSIHNVNILNFGRIIGGNGGAGTGVPDGEVLTVSNGGWGGAGIDLFASSFATLENVSITNASSGLIAGGNAGAGSADSGAGGGDGISLFSPESRNLVVTNFGTIRGGDASGTGENAIAGIGINASTSKSANISGLVINNWGTISAGNDPRPLLERDAIHVRGSNNVINLEGHSAVYGKITVVNGGDTTSTNVVNLNFTGVDAATLASLRASVLAQGGNTGQDTPLVTFTLRGVTYVIDPAIVTFAMSSYQLQGLTANQQSVGANLDSMKVNPTGDMLTLVNAIDWSGNVPSALAALSPQAYQVYSDIAISNSTFTTLEIDQRLNNRRNGSEGIDTSAFRVAQSDIGNRLGFAGARGRGGKEIRPPSKEAVPMSPDKRWGGFLSGTAIFGDLDSRGDLGDTSFTTAGLLFGLDYRVTDSLVVGALFGFSSTDADLDARGSNADVETYTGGLYAGWHDGPYYVNAVAAYSHNDYDSNRRIFIPQTNPFVPGVNRSAAGSTSGDQFMVNIDGGYDHVVNDRVVVGPIIGLQYVHLDVDSFTESPGVGSLAVGGQEMDSLRSRLGARARFRKAYSSSTVVAAEARAQWQHEFLDDSRSITGTFVGSGLAPFAVPTDEPGRDSALLGVGFNVTFRENYTIFVDYDAQVGSDVLQSIKGGFKAAF